MTLKKKRNKDDAAEPQDITSLNNTNSLFFRLARLLPDSFYRTAAVRRLLKAGNREEAEAVIGMAGLLVEILSHGWLASSLIPTHIGQWIAWLPFDVPWGPEVMGPLAMAAYTTIHCRSREMPRGIGDILARSPDEAQLSGHEILGGRSCQTRRAP